MKSKDMQSMSPENLEKKLFELKKELIKLNAQVATGTSPKNTMQIKGTKKAVSRILTLLSANKKSNKGLPQISGNKTRRVKNK